MTFKQALKEFNIQLSNLYEGDELFALFLITAGLNNSSYILKQDAAADDKLLQMLGQLTTGEPIQYIIGEAEFYGLKFKVTPDVLIPRPETEELVHWIITMVKEKWPGENVSLLDIGTGSGCIPITLDKKLPLASISGLDVSSAALDIAKQNNNLNGTAVNFILADIFSYAAADKFNVIVSNPPYITQREKRVMHKNVIDHEPHLALFVPDNDPLIFYNTIADFALGHLHNDGCLFFEINADFGDAVVKMLRSKGFDEVALKKDMQGKDRMVLGVLCK